MNDTLGLHCSLVPTQQMIYVFLCLTLRGCLLLYSDRHVGMTGIYCHTGLDPASRALAGFVCNHYLPGFPGPAPDPIRGEGEMNLVILPRFLSLVTPGAGLFLTLPNELNRLMPLHRLSTPDFRLLLDSRLYFQLNEPNEPNELFSLLNQSTNQLLNSPFLYSRLSFPAPPLPCSSAFFLRGHSKSVLGRIK